MLFKNIGEKARHPAVQRGISNKKGRPITLYERFLISLVVKTILYLPIIDILQTLLIIGSVESFMIIRVLANDWIRRNKGTRLCN